MAFTGHNWSAELDQQVEEDLPSEPEESVLIGMVFDVSGSMKRHVTRSCGRSESWASSIFRIMDDLLSSDDTWRNQVFAFGAGAEPEKALKAISTWNKEYIHMRNEMLAIGKVSEAIDILRTLNDYQEIPESFRRRVRSPVRHTKETLIQLILNQLATNGAPNIRGWITHQIVASRMNLEDAELFYATLTINRKFLKEVVYGCLPEMCRLRKDIQPNSSLGERISQLRTNVTDTAKSWATSSTIKSAEVSRVIERATDLWKQMHPVVVSEIDSHRAVFDGKRALELLKGGVLRDSEELTNERVDKLMESIEPYIYGGTPLIKTLEEAMRVFRENGAQRKVLFVLSDGEPADGKHAPVAALRDLGVYVVCCYVTDKNLEGKRLYATENPEWDTAAKFMFNLSSAISTHRIPRTVFIQRGWKIDFANNETKLFVQVNNPDLLKDVTELVGDVVGCQDSLADLLGSVSLDLFINQVNDKFNAQDQEGRTCYANAAAAVMYLAMKRIYKRQATPRLPDTDDDPNAIGYPYFYEDEAQSNPDNFYILREELIEEFGKKGTHTSTVLSAVCPRYRLRCEQVTLVGAMKAVSSKQPVVATFKLSAHCWGKFEAFYLWTPQGILDKADLDLDFGQRTGDDMTGHAVVLTSYNSQGLRFMNSWGTKWGDSGFFMVKRNALPKLKFYNVFWEESDLKEFEQQAYAESGKTVAETLISKYQALNTLKFWCRKCREESQLIEYRRSGGEAVCPRCRGTVRSTPELRLSLYLQSLARNAKTKQ